MKTRSRDQGRTAANGMPLGGGAVEPADVPHVDETLGGKVYGALTQRLWRGVVNQRVWQTVAKRLRGAIEIRFY